MAPLISRGRGGLCLRVARISLLGMLLVSACAPPSLHIAPAHEGMSGKEVAFLNHESAPFLGGHTMALRKVDGVQVGSFLHVYLSPGWHFFEYGFRVDEGCNKYKHTRVYVNYGVAVLREPWRDRSTCLEPIIRDHVYSGWFLLEGGRRYRWSEIQPILKKLPETRDPGSYDKSIPGVLYRNG